MDVYINSCFCWGVEAADIIGWNYGGILYQNPFTFPWCFKSVVDHHIYYNHYGNRNKKDPNYQVLCWTQVQTSNTIQVLTNKMKPTK